MSSTRISKEVITRTHEFRFAQAPTVSELITVLDAIPDKMAVFKLAYCSGDACLSSSPNVFRFVYERKAEL